MARPSTQRPAWTDRWTQPTLEQLLASIEETRLPFVQSLIDQISAYDGVEQRVIWYGTSWKWTLQFVLNDEKGEELGILAYLIPNPQTPMLCIPLRDEMIAKLPMRRLNRYIRDGIRLAKCAVEIHWAIWNPVAGTEVEYLMDLIKRKHKIMRA